MSKEKQKTSEDMKETIDLKQNNTVYIVINGKKITIPAPYHGDITIKTVAGKIQKYDMRESFTLK